MILFIIIEAKHTVHLRCHIEKQTVCNGKRTHRLNDNNSTRNNQRITRDDGSIGTYYNAKKLYDI